MGFMATQWYLTVCRRCSQVPRYAELTTKTAPSAATSRLEHGMEQDVIRWLQRTMATAGMVVRTIGDAV
jgi:hypothetical protein